MFIIRILLFIFVGFSLYADDLGPIDYTQYEKEHIQERLSQDQKDLKKGEESQALRQRVSQDIQEKNEYERQRKEEFNRDVK